MRPIFAKSAFAAFAALASSTSLAQSLEESYANLCADPAKAKSETCQILAKSLVSKLQGQQAPSVETTETTEFDQATSALWRKRWGLFADYMGKETFNVIGPGATIEVRRGVLDLRAKMEWVVPGKRAVSKMRMADGVWHETSTMEWDESSQRLINISPPPSSFTMSFFAKPDGSLEAPEATYFGATVRSITRPLAPGSYETVGETKKDGVWVESSRTMTVEYSPERLALQSQRLEQEQQQALRQAAQQQQQERDEKRAKSQQRAAMFNSVVQGLSDGLSQGNTGGYADAQANLDATVANINAAAAMERQQQALAQQQEQARAAEQQRQQLAENARWVAEKEQAAVEYRSGHQVDAAAAAEEAHVLAANAEAAAERARRAQTQRQQAAADAKGSVVDPKPPASAGTSLLGGPKESGRGGSTCNEELACRKTCAGDVVAVTECVKQCGRESACRVGIQ